MFKLETMSLDCHRYGADNNPKDTVFVDFEVRLGQTSDQAKRSATEMMTLRRPDVF